MILADNTVLTNFALIGRLDLLRVAFDSIGIRTTSKVRQEFNRGVRKGLLLRNASPTLRHWRSLLFGCGIGKRSFAGDG